MDEREYERLVEATELMLCTLAVATARCTDSQVFLSVLEGLGRNLTERSSNDLLGVFVKSVTGAVRDLGPPRPHRVS